MFIMTPEKMIYMDEVRDILDKEAARLGLPSINWFWGGTKAFGEATLPPSEVYKLVQPHLCLMADSLDEIPSMRLTAMGGEQGIYPIKPLDDFQRAVLDLAGQIYLKKKAALDQAIQDYLQKEMAA